MSLPHAVIIAGGQGSRLGGVRKADLRIGGVRLIERVRAALGAVQQPILVASGPRQSALTLDAKYRGVSDLDAPLGGPLAGLVAAVAALQADGIAVGTLVSVAVDTPHLPDDFAATMVECQEDAACAFVQWGEDFYPPNAIWRLEALATLPERVLAGTAPPSLKALQRELGAMAVDWRRRAALNPFANVNTLKDVVDLQQLAERPRR